MPDTPNQTSTPAQPVTDERELPPETQAALGRARRSFAVSIGILLLGFMTLLGVLVYRVMRDAPPPPMAAELVVPPGSAVLGAVYESGAISVTVMREGVTELLVFDAETGERRNTVTITAR